MKKEKEGLARKCPYCGGMENQVSNGKNRSGSQQCFCKPCKILHTRPETARNPAGNQTARHKDAAWGNERPQGWGSIGIQSSKCIQLVKKNSITQTFTEQRFAGVYELDELYWFIERKADSETRDDDDD